MQAAPDLPLRSSRTIQGNILAPFNKPCQLLLFLNFGNRQDKARAWLTDLVDSEIIATTDDVVQHDERRRNRKKGQEPEKRTWVGVSLTSSAVVTLHPELAADLVVYDAFWRGALADRSYGGARRTASPALIGNERAGDPSRWVIGGPSQPPVDALLTIAADDARRLGYRAAKERRRAADHDLGVLLVRQGNGRMTKGQRGERLVDENGGIEHFGFRDGVSQPGIRGFTAAKRRGRRLEAEGDAGTPVIAAGEFVLGQEREAGSYPEDPRSQPPSWMWDGSFQVFLRLNQDVGGWRAQMDALSASSRPPRVDVAAMAIGRFKDGTPLARGGNLNQPNDFTYGNDPHGEDTPRFAHIRKMNPRNDAPFHARIHRLLRRGIPFGPFIAENTPADGDKAERGLLFNAFMASIENQFEFLQRNWASNPRSLPETPMVADGPDPVAGASEAPCILRRRNQDPVEFHLERFVWTTGAVYAFAPSIPTLRMLGGAEKLRDG
jgi:Dyp-type peroxidase family